MGLYDEIRWEAALPAAQNTVRGDRRVSGRSRIQIALLIRSAESASPGRRRPSLPPAISTVSISSPCSSRNARG